MKRRERVMKKFSYTWKQILATPSLLRFYGWQLLKIWLIVFMMGVMLGSLDLVGLAWRTGLWSIGALFLVVATAKYCPNYFKFQKEE